MGSSSNISGNSSIDSNACLNHFDNRDKFNVFINYRRKPTEQLDKSFRISCPRCESSYVEQTSSHLQQSLKEQVGNKLYHIKSHFTVCGISPRDDDISILGKPKRGEYRLLRT